MTKYIKLLRVKHWIKNLLIFIPFICSGLLTKSNTYKCILGFIAFSFMASVIYIVNDIKDIEKDRNHPRKKNRPLASGQVKKSTAITIAIFMIILSVIINTILNKNFFNIPLVFLISYFLINIAYSLGLKNKAIIDVVLLASGFIIRVYYGASLINVEVSRWLFLTILNGSLFLGLGKRKKELINNKESRIVLKDYNAEFLDKFQYLTLTLTLVFYSLWTIEQTSKYLYLTIPIVMVTFMKYCLNIEKGEEGDPTTILFSDKILLFLSLLYCVLMVLFLIIL